METDVWVMADTVVTVQISLPDETASALSAAVRSGEYREMGDIVCEALADWHWQRSTGVNDNAQLRKLAQDSISSGPGQDAGAVFARLEARYADSSKA